MTEIDKKTFRILKRAVRTAWQHSIEYHTVMKTAHKGRGKWECFNCKHIVPRINLYLEHIIPIASQVKEGTIEELYHLHFDTTNVQPWCKTCKPAKDKQDNLHRRAK